MTANYDGRRITPAARQRRLSAGIIAPPMFARLKSGKGGRSARGSSERIVEAEKRKELSAAQFRRNSIPGLAQDWSVQTYSLRHSGKEEALPIRRMDT